MFDRILVPLDISETSEIVIPYASELAGKFGSELILYHVRVEPPDVIQNQLGTEFAR